MAAVKKPLSGAAVRHLRGLGHALDPVIALGKAGITEAFVAETKRALVKHELVKVRVQGEAPVDRKEAAAEVAAQTGAELVQVLGRTFLLYKKNPEKSKIVLPKPLTKSEKQKADKAAKKAAAKTAKPAKGAVKPAKAAVAADDDGDGDGHEDDDGDSDGDGDGEAFEGGEDDVDGGVEGDDDADDEEEEEKDDA